MVETALTVCWNGHTREFTTVYKSLLENNVLVDCTVSAEGQSLKAHKLVLSACSPYFQRLFQEETGKHAFVILLDASFATLKAVIDFVYRGETQIPAENLKAFLTLARSLQIKGLDAFSDENKNHSSNTTGNTPQKPFEDNQVTNTTQSISTSHRDGTQNSSQLHPHSDKYPDAVNTTSSVPIEGYSASREMVWFPQEYRRPPECTEVPVSTEGIVKHQPSNAVTTEKEKEVSNNVNSDECLSGNFLSEVNQGTASLFGQRNLNQYSSCLESSHENMDSSEMLPSQQHQHMQLSNEMSSSQDVEQDEPLLPLVFVPVSEDMDEESEESMDDDIEVLENDTNERVEGTEASLSEQNLNQCSSAESLPPENAQSLQLSGSRSPSRGALQSDALPLQPAPQLHEGQRSRGVIVQQNSSEESALADVVRQAFFNLPSQIRTYSRSKPFGCELCGKEFISRRNLVQHQLVHTGERPYRCDVCGSAFARSDTLKNHKRMHTGDRPYGCDACGVSFSRPASLAIHKRIHERNAVSP